MATPYDIDNNFKSKPHPLNHTQSWHCEELRISAASLAQDILDYVPDSRERSLALTNLEQAMFWANAAVARHPEQEVEVMSGSYGHLNNGGWSLIEGMGDAAECVEALLWLIERKIGRTEAEILLQTEYYPMLRGEIPRDDVLLVVQAGMEVDDV